MTNLGTFLGQLTRGMAAETLRDRSDQQLVEELLAGRDEAVFEAIVRRHGPMVYRVCWRVARHHEDAEDAFQATFLLLAQKLRTVRQHASLASWLHGVAYRVALKARAQAAARRRHEDEASSEAVPPEETTWAELRAALDAELGQMPEKWRLPLILCYLEGWTRDEAAAQLGWSGRTLRRRLEEAREALGRRLTRRGVAWPAALSAVLLSDCVASAALSRGLVGSTIETLTAASARVEALAEGVFQPMFFTNAKVIASLAAGVLLTAGLITYAARAGGSAAKQAEVPKQETGDQRATRLARDAHARAAAIDKLPRFSYQVRSRHGIVDSLRAVDPTLEILRKGLTDPVLQPDWFGWYKKSFSWDEKRFILESLPGDTILGCNFRFWTRDQAWALSHNKARTSVQLTLHREPADLWDVPSHPSGTSVMYFDFGYLLHTPHRFWWGRSVARGNSHLMTLVPLEKAAWKAVGKEQFGGEACEVIESPERGERLWISTTSGQVRGVLAGLADGAANELVQFDDFREIAPGISWPFRETQTFRHSSEIRPGKSMIRRAELVVEKIQTDRDLAARYKELLPRAGERVQDQRFVAPLDYDYSPARTDEQIRRQAEARYKEILKGLEEFKKVVQPIEAMVGQPAPPLPAEGWVNGKRPDVKGKPYLVHFWATLCGPCKYDLPRLQALADKGVVTVGMHPAGTPAHEVEKLIRDQKLGYPTLLAADTKAKPKKPMVGGYPVGVYPYCVLVDAKGQVAGHGFLSEVMEKFGEKALTAP
jgi:RNA polymerase sigma factor (sigma-70 family)